MTVDDSLVMQEEMRRMLEDSGIEIASACRSGEEALERFEEARPDVVLMDIVMPGMDGLAATSALLSRWPETPVVIVSSLAYDDTTRWANEIGAKGVIFKPFKREELISAVYAAAPRKKDDEQLDRG